MSGIVGIVNLDGAPVDRELLTRMTHFMSYRGPDEQKIWIDTNVGFGHTMLRTTFEAETEHQPLTIDGKVWLTADARIDGRAELIPKLEAKLRTTLRVEDRSNGSGSRLPNDAELILYAHRAWGEDLVEHLIGDFSFALWDSRHRRLLCGRDHFGVKPFFYAQVGNTLIFSNTLNCVRVYPEVSNCYNDIALADFLVFGSTQDCTATVFREIRRLPSGHLLILENQRIWVSRYWRLQLEEPLKYRNPDDYIGEFNSLFGLAIRDRLQTKHIGVRMSGGLDSSAVAAAACAQLVEMPSSDLRAFTVVYDELIPDDERYYSSLVANKLDIPIHHLKADQYDLFEGLERLAQHFPEPFDHPLAIVAFEEFKNLSSFVRVVLTGQGGDPLLKGSSSHYFDLVGQKQFAQVIRDIIDCLRIGQKPSFLVRTNLRRLMGTKPCLPAVPIWLSEQSDSHASRQLYEARTSVTTHGQGRTEAYGNLANPGWAMFFEQTDSAMTNVPVEVRHPFFDLRIVSFLLALPTVPWCCDKEIVRRAMRGTLPEAVRCRPKTPLRRDPTHILLTKNGVPKKVFQDVPEISCYVDEKKWVQSLDIQANDPFSSWLNTRPITLAYWLKAQRSKVGRGEIDK